MLYVIIALALAFNFLNGFQGSSSCVATIVSSRAMSPRLALGMTAVAVFVGPLIFGIAVAYTIGVGIVTPQSISPPVITAALISAVLWSLLTWALAVPSSPSHALVGGLVGAVGASAGLAQVQAAGITKVLLALFLAPFLGFIAGFLITRLVFFLARNASLKINWWFMKGQYVTGLILGLSNGANDGPKGMGIMALGLVTTGALAQFQVPLWVILSSSLAMSLGTVLGGLRLIQTLGGRFFRVRPVDSFCSQVSSAAVTLTAAMLGGPVSTTQVVSSAILGVGAAERINKVRWGLAGNIALTWLLTIPANIALAWGLYWVISRF